MLLLSRQMFGASVVTEDGEIGKLVDFLFDDRDWTVKSLIVDAGNRADGRVSLSPQLVMQKDWRNRRIRITGSTDDRIEKVSDPKPLTAAEHSMGLKGGSLAGWMLNWNRIVRHPRRVAVFTVRRLLRSVVCRVKSLRRNIESSQLRSTNKVMKYSLRQTDGRMGRAVDFLIDEESWKIRYLEADTSAWWLGKRVLIMPEWIENIDAPKRILRLDISRHALKQSLVYHPAMEEARSCETARVRT